MEKIKFKIASKNLNCKGRVSIENGIKKSTNHFNTKISWVQINFFSGETKNIVFDLDDNPYQFGEHALRNADLYFKRCFQEQVVKEFPDKINTKIKPLGLPFMVRPDKLYKINRIKLTFYIFKLNENFRMDRLIKRRIKFFRIKGVNQFKGFVNTRTISDFKTLNNENFKSIFYQKRLFSQRSEDIIRVNEQRVGIIKLLKNNFPSSFYGGLQKNRISVLKYPELISNISGDQHSFLEAMKKCGICIYTNGLMGSPGWTLSEFLAQGKCIIAEKLENILPHPLIDGQHLVYFSNEEELLMLCNELINNSEKRLHLGRNARQYYEEYVDPTVFFRNILMTNFE